MKAIPYSIHEIWLSGLQDANEYISQDLWCAVRKDLLIWKDTVKKLNADNLVFFFNFPHI